MGFQSQGWVFFSGLLANTEAAAHTCKPKKQEARQRETRTTALTASWVALKELGLGPTEARG